ncbi:asparagine synthase (glutamine-hydrolysing) [Aeromonas sp. RU39B]|uniref:asparagine synthase B n=1 Tax=Aeromonas sp. RU39B TaxID=1907416 RepID=UPI0009543E55|nr:asparagine synthase B [Aeromonas sp. RU39B]SIR36213.1 asparagine synthase (glutamine-hydrolysing) [Aeromonas sp. RU39B]
MCSIFGILDIKSDAVALRKTALEMSKRLRHRGPDWSGVYSTDKAILVHERLAIVDPGNGAQPLYNPERTHVLAVNGEIYNHKELEKGLKVDFQFQTKSDCEVLLALYKEKGPAFLDDLNGIFAFILYDAEQDAYLIGRDHMGIIPLYTGRDEHGNFYVASEMKALVPVCKSVETFPPGHYLWSKDGELKRWYQRDWMQYSNVEHNVSDKAELKEALEAAVKRQLMCDVPYGVLLSGGLDSSIISAITKLYAARRIEDDGNSEAWWPQLHSFAVGLKGSPDLAAAQKVADYLGTVHHQIHFTVQEGLDALKDVIYHLETYDVTTIRASTPMYLMARFIKAMGIKMVLSGEGSDELFGGYLYFHKAPNAREFHDETVRKLDALHLYDCLRANKSMAAWGVEGRVPFLDKEFMDVAMRLNPVDKMCGHGKIEKHILREVFGEMLPHEVAWRQKEQFSDGVGYSWIDSLKAMVDQEVTDQMFEAAAYRFPVNTPLTKEAYYYRSIFEEHFPSESAARTVPYGKSVACSTPTALEWDAKFKEMADPSGRAVLDVHQQAY